MKRAKRLTKRERKEAAMSPFEQFAADRMRGQRYLERRARKLVNRTQQAPNG